MSQKKAELTQRRAFIVKRYEVRMKLIQRKGKSSERGVGNDS